MTDPAELEARLAAVEPGLDEVRSDVAGARADAAAAHHLAAAHDRDVADLGVKVDANRWAINALGEQTRAGFDRLEQRMDAGFAEMRGTLDQTAAGMERIVALLTDRDG